MGGNKRGPEYLGALVDAVASGVSISRAAEMVGRSTTTCWETIQRYAPDLPRNMKPRVSSSERLEYQSRYESGESILQIAMSVHRDWETVDRAIYSDEPIYVNEHRCDGCGATINTHYCMRCSMQFSR